MQRLAGTLVAVILGVSAPFASAQTPPVPPTQPTVGTEPAAVPSPSVAGSEVTVNVGRAPPMPSLVDPIAKPTLDIPAGLINTQPNGPIAPPAPLLPTAPQAKLTPVQIAKEIAPNFDVTRDYTRLVQCYGTADFMGAVTRIQASRPGATPQIIGVARTIIALQEAMQPMVLAVSTVRGEPRFRADYDAFARQGQRELATSKTPNATMQRRLATLDACRRDVSRWRNGR